MALLTKSRFKLALECPTKLYYASHKDLYEDQQLDDPFLEALAEGGYQVGELAKYLFCDDPVADDITISELDYATSLSKTEIKRSNGGPVVIAEAAFQFEQYFVRTDLITEDNAQINIYEVKAKSWDEDVVFLSEAKRGANRGTVQISNAWSSYLYDIAFQKWVVQKANPNKKVKAFIVLADKTKKTSVDGLNQLFNIKRNKGRVEIEVASGITRKDLGEIPLKVINVDDVCDWIYANPVAIDLEGTWYFEKLIKFIGEKFLADEIIWTNCIGKKCKDCQFINPEYPKGKRSGFHECWKKLANFTNDDFKKPLVLELWGGGAGAKSIVGDAIDKKLYFMDKLDETDYASPKWEPPVGDFMDATKRRSIQILKTKKQDFTPYLDRDGLKELFESLQPPYHFIDFETTAVAIPFHGQRKPYEAVAFQYSYHLMDEKGNIEHKSQYLSFDRGVFPNYEFLRQLRNDLSGKQGTIFRYHKHENNYLNHIYKQLKEGRAGSVSDKDDLMAFVQEIATPTSKNADTWEPQNNMQDLYDFVVNHFYSLHAKGSNSIKAILPAVIRSSDYLLEKYSQPVYATASMPSLNFTVPHIWIDNTKDLNPYKTLPELFSEVDRMQFDLTDNSMQELNNGGAAMMAYAYLQFTDMSDEQRAIYRDGLLRYCELDTMAMVMIWEYWGKEIGAF